MKEMVPPLEKIISEKDDWDRRKYQNVKDNNEDDKEIKRGKHKFIVSIISGYNSIAYITRGFPILKTSSKGLLKGKTFEVIMVDKKEENSNKD